VKIHGHPRHAPNALTVNDVVHGDDLGQPIALESTEDLLLSTWADSEPAESS